MKHPHLHGPTLSDSMESARLDREAAGAALRADVEAKNEVVKGDSSQRSMGWHVTERPDGRWNWSAHWDGDRLSGHEATWAEAVHAAKIKFEQLERASS